MATWKKNSSGAFTSLLRGFRLTVQPDPRYDDYQWHVHASGRLVREGGAGTLAKAKRAAEHEARLTYAKRRGLPLPSKFKSSGSALIKAAKALKAAWK